MYPAKTEPMIKNTTHSIGCNGMANDDDYHGLEMYKNNAKDSTTEGYLQPDPTTMECGRIIPPKGSRHSSKENTEVGPSSHAATKNLEKQRPLDANWGSTWSKAKSSTYHLHARIKLPIRSWVPAATAAKQGLPPAPQRDACCLKMFYLPCNRLFTLIMLLNLNRCLLTPPMLADSPRVNVCNYCEETH